MPEADETIITRFIVEADKAIEETSKFRKQIDTIKAQIKATAKVTKDSFDVVAASIKRVRIKEFSNDIANLKDELDKLRSVKGLKNLTAIGIKKGEIRYNEPCI